MERPAQRLAKQQHRNYCLHKRKLAKYYDNAVKFVDQDDLRTWRTICPKYIAAKAFFASHLPAISGTSLKTICIVCVICYYFLLCLLHFFNTHGSTIIGYAVVASQPCIFFITYMLLQSKAKLNKIKIK